MNKVAVLRECLRSNWHFQEEVNLTFKNLTNVDFYAWGEEPTPNVPEIYDVSEMFHDRSLKILNEKKKVVVSTEEPSVLQTIKYLNDRGQNLEKVIGKPFHFVARTTWARDTLIQLGADGDKISVIPFAVDLKKFKPRKVERKYKFPTYLYVGSLSVSKGVKTLIESFKKLETGNLILVYGEFNNNPVVEALARKTKNVHLIQWSPDIENIYNQADIYVQPQAYGFNGNGGILHFGKPMQWALASRLPIISLNQGSARDFVDDWTNGFLCNKSKEIFDRMSRLVEYKDEVYRMGVKSRMKAEEQFSPEVVADKYHEVYNAV